ncbi:hypothetical protein BB559_005168 [Furculomyces boomerangus]|uniref:54S ribosomal protein L31, mitochondrial n=2 Tax=Harpellales TaxID=61421 RepID=A0A2T9YA92_9FUNG|nr:hypothetical protein BB559_005168 [Furculomyces boomerangus]PVZ98978.1 hypothetical protein BB558_005009 [Smittium angustum]
MFGSYFGAFRASFVPFGGRAWRIPWKLNKTRKANVRKRLSAVDDVIQTLVDSGVQLKSLELAKALPKEHEMLPKNKYTTFSRVTKTHRKGVHKVPKFTKVPIPRTMPVGF